jgi:hypothetical protein
MKHLNRLITMSVSAAFAACGNGGDSPAAAVKEGAPQVELSQTLCDLLPQAEAEKIMGKALVQQRNDAWGCHYEDARGTTGTGLWISLNILSVSDQCRVTPHSEPVSSFGSEACISSGNGYATVVFSGGGRTFEATAPGRDRTSEQATAVAKAILSKLKS